MKKQILQKKGYSGKECVKLGLKSLNKNLK